MYRRIQDVYARTALEIREIKLTEAQFGAIEAEVWEQRSDRGPVFFDSISTAPQLFGIPIRIVDSVFDSTPFQLWIDQLLKERFYYR